MVAQVILVHLVRVRILAGLPFFLKIELFEGKYALSKMRLSR